MVAPRAVDWAPLRRAYVERSPRPTYEALAVEFSTPTTTIQRCASEEAWPAMRAAYLDGKLRECDAASVMLEAVQTDRSLVRRFASVAALALDKLASTVESIDDARAPQTKAQALNTCSFALKNLADSLRAVGIVGVAKGLDAAGKEANGQWNPQMLSQINLTVQNLVSQGKGESTDVAVRPTPGGPASG